MRAARALAALVLLAGCQSQPPVLEAPMKPQAQRHRPEPKAEPKAAPKRNADRQLRAIQSDIQALQRSLREEETR